MEILEIFSTRRTLHISMAGTQRKQTKRPSSFTPRLDTFIVPGCRSLHTTPHSTSTSSPGTLPSTPKTHWHWHWHWMTIDLCWIFAGVENRFCWVLLSQNHHLLFIAWETQLVRCCFSLRLQPSSRRIRSYGWRHRRERRFRGFTFTIAMRMEKSLRDRWQ